MIRHAGHRLARKLKLWQNDVLMRASFWQNISLQALLVQKLKISTLDGAKSPGDFFWTIVILHAQIAHLLKSIIVQACTIIFLKSSFQLGVCNSMTIKNFKIRIKIGAEKGPYNGGPLHFFNATTYTPEQNFFKSKATKNSKCILLGIPWFEGTS